MPLVLAGYGVYKGSFTLELLEALDRADVVYVELYTAPHSNWVLEALKPWSHKVRAASRKSLEEGSARVVEEAASKFVVVMSPGDPLIATTHHALLAESRVRGVEARYIPGVSGVCSAKAYSGLSYYRFGRTVTIPGPWRGVKPYTPILTIYGNLCIDAHTLLLLDVADEGAQLDPREAAAILLEVEDEVSRELGLKEIVKGTPAILIGGAGTPEPETMLYESLQDIEAESRTLKQPSSIIMPAPLNPIEKWLIETTYSKKLGETWTRRNYNSRIACEAYARLKEFSYSL
ncbi:MAG: diphthine synthase [Thermoprotei archaeon]|nr:diphthine synthase [Thermoprotei archaeon]